MKYDQLDIFDKKEPIETVIIQPTKDMPFEVFRQLHRIAYFMELMERLDDGRIIWNESVTSIYSEELAEVEYWALQEEWFSMNMELPKKLIDTIQNEQKT